MRMIKLFSCILLLVITLGAYGHPGQSASLLAPGGAYAQEMQQPAQTPAASNEPEKKPEPSTALYQVLGVVMFIWLGIAFFLFRLDRRVARLEKQSGIGK